MTEQYGELLSAGESYQLAILPNKQAPEIKHQRLYSQIPKKEFNNSSNCASGCGATAWAMLFGWG